MLVSLIIMFVLKYKDLFRYSKSYVGIIYNDLIEELWFFSTGLRELLINEKLR